MVDGDVVMLSAHWERRRGALLILQEQLQQLPTFLTDLESITARVGETDTEHTFPDISPGKVYELNK